MGTKFIHTVNGKYINMAFVSKIEWDKGEHKYRLYDAGGEWVGSAIIPNPEAELTPCATIPAEPGYSVMCKYDEYYVHPVLAWNIYDNVVVPVTLDWSVNEDIIGCSAIGCGPSTGNLVYIAVIRPNGKLYDLDSGALVAESIEQYKEKSCEIARQKAEHERQWGEAKKCSFVPTV